jgi:hypothetical protein
VIASRTTASGGIRTVQGGKGRRLTKLMAGA